jgi:hypothetical protein
MPTDLLNDATFYLNAIKNSKAGVYLPKVSIALHQRSTDRRSSPKTSFHQQPVLVERNDRLILNLYEKDLIGIPPLVLQGWLDIEIFSYIIRKHNELHRFNFERDILPLYYVSGAAVQLMRYLVHQIDIGLRQALATNMILDAGHGLPLLYYYFYTIGPAEEDKEDYRRFFPHCWLKAIFLCKKFADFQSIYLLKSSGITPEIERYWWQCHSHLITEDRKFLEMLVSTTHQYRGETFAFRLVEIFKLVKTNILKPTTS